MKVKTLLTISTIAVFSFIARADDGNGNGNNQSSVVGSTPGMTIGAVASGGAAWVVKEGEASVSSSGRVRVEVRGLLLGVSAAAGAAAGTTGPVKMVGATLVCGGSGGAPAAPVMTVTPSPLSAAGNAEIDQLVTLPTPACVGPVVLVRVFNAATQQLGAFIAASGVMPGAAQDQDHEH